MYKKNILKRYLNTVKYLKENGVLYYLDYVDKYGTTVFCSWHFKPNINTFYFDSDFTLINENYITKKLDEK